MLIKTENFLRRCSAVSAAVGGLVLIAIAGVTVTSVIGRAWFSRPIYGDVELVQLGCAVVVACFLPFTQFRRANIIVDFFTTRCRLATQNKLDTLGTLLYALVLAVITWRVAVGSIDIRAAQETSMLMALPLWIPYTLMLPGLLLATLIGVYQTARGFLGLTPSAT